ncbi:MULTISPECIES: FAD-dependent monooxygenase [Streptomyces]|uniref:FAD-dependent monooxygenase n=1 Tax=Streptomyces TaxID=1883 RepID=UPI001679EBA9|nr:MULTISPECIES: FAD-dependent monooxygenase [Streptomyces]MBD3575357.1 FAD-dependent monooxygenase [Streptomyces sp. KD18]GGS92605.1 3-(3-hydroxyphenyl)propionate hydroxylase [Streptomyces toxytricini]
MQAQVVIIGGGPVGLLIAAELAGYGVDTVVLEAQDAVSERPKATTLHARAVQCLARRGHLPEHVPLSAGGAGCGCPFHFAGLPGLVITAPEGEPEPILKWPQAELERLFEARARQAGARILRGHRVAEIRQTPAPCAGSEGAAEDGGAVTVRAEGPHGPLTLTARYAVGADGARSTVREQAGITSETHPATVSALTGTVRLRDGALADGWHRTPHGWIVAKSDPHTGDTHIRTLNCAGAHSERHLPPTLDELRREVAWIAGRRIAMDEPRWLGRFSDFARLAGKFRRGRVFLAGDAAHVHFPIGGQGLSTGVLDALNLGWKLALAVHGQAGPGLLDSYDRERRPAARRVLDNTRAQLALMRPGPELDALRGLFAALLSADRDAGLLRNMISAQDTVLPGCTGRTPSGGGTFLPNVALHTEQGETDVIGLLQEGRPLLLLFGDGGGVHPETARDWEGVVRVVRARPVPEVPYEALLVRPDGYVAWAPGGEGLEAALSAHFAAPARAVLP